VQELCDWLGEDVTLAMLSPWPLLCAWRVHVLSHPNVAAFMAGPHRQPSPADPATGDQYYREVRAALKL
jgi:hypothetical protein